jgi:hypothetical protein
MGTIKEDEKKIVGQEKVEQPQAKPLGVSDSAWEGTQKTFSTSDKVNNAQTKVDSASTNYTKHTQKDMISSSTEKAMNKSFKVPTAVKEADAWLATQLEQIQSGKTSYSDDVRNMMDKIMNREKFSYDVDTDPLFQQALASAMNSGKQAMQDTIGQASALTGGYGSTYATSAGNQAYNSFIEDAYDNLPQYYEMALQKYQMEGDELFRQFGMVSEMDDKEYNRNLSAYDATYQHRNQMWNEAYTMHRDSVSDAFAKAGIEMQQYAQEGNDLYNLYTMSSNTYESLYEKDYQSWADSVNNAWKQVEVENSDAWANKNFDEGVRQYEKNYAQTEDHFTRNQEFQATESQKQRDWQSAEADKDRAFTASENAKNRAASRSSGSGGGGGSKIKSATENQMKNALKAYNEGGMDGLNKYLNSVPDNYDKDSIALYVGEYGELPLEQRTYTKTKDTWNGLWGIDNNDLVKDQYGNSYKIKELPKAIQKDLTKLKEGKSFTKK